MCITCSIIVGELLDHFSVAVRYAHFRLPIETDIEMERGEGEGVERLQAKTCHLLPFFQHQLLAFLFNAATKLIQI